MIRWIFIVVIFFHAVIHLMGFAKAFGYGSFEQLTKPISRAAGVWWLMAAVLLLLALILFVFENPGWWMIALPAIVVSQVLIFSVWQDVRFGTIANVLFLIPAIVAVGTWQFDRQYRATRDLLISEQTPRPTLVAEEALTSIPIVVQQWLRASGAVGQPIAPHTFLTQTGRMLSKPGGTWMPFVAEQHFTTEPPAFVWRTKVEAAPLTFLLGQDVYHEGKGHMQIKLFGLVPIVDAQSATIDQGTLVRYLAETCWFPSAALSPYITWKQLSDTSATATMRYAGVEASGEFFFDEASNLIAFEAMRYGEFDGVSRLERWHIACADHREMDGVRVPTRCAVSWKLKDGDFRWLELHVTDLQRK